MFVFIFKISQVLLGEVNVGLSTTQVVVKELKASASVQDQMQFLEEVQPYRSVHIKKRERIKTKKIVTEYLLLWLFWSPLETLALGLEIHSRNQTLNTFIGFCMENVM